jgi:tetratricopeptide (TPR) repeat protein
VVAAAAVALTLYFGRGGDEQPVGIGASGRPAVAVMPFDCTAASEDLRWLRQGVPDMLVTGLAQTQGLDVVSSERLLEILDRLAPESAASIAPRHVLEVARRAGAGAVVVGTVMGGGPELRIDVRVQDPADGRLLFAHGVRGEELFALVDEITKQIRVGLGLATAPFDRGIAELTSESLEAYRLYVEGFNAARNMRSSDAHELFRRAVEIDPSFTMAYYELSISPYSFDPALRDEYREKTLQGLDRLSERERLQVGSRAASWEGDDERALALQEELVARYPDQADAYRRLAYLYRTVLGDTEKEMQALERGIRAVPTYGPLRNRFAYQLLKAGRFNEGIRQLEEYAQMAPEEPNPHDGMGEAYLMFGRPEEAIAKFTDAIEVDDRFFISYLGRAWAYAVLGHYDKALSEVEAVEDVADGDEVPLIDALFFKGLLLAQVGRYREAELAVDEIHRLAEPTGVAILHFAAWSLSSMTALDRGDHFAAIESATRALETPDRDRDLEEVVLVAHVLAGIGEAFSGRLAAAAEHQHDAAALLDHQDVNETWLYHSLEGEIALASGDLARAEAAFASGLPTGKISANRSASFFFDHTSPSRDWKARIHIARRDAAGAIAEYRRLLTPSADQKFVGVLEPRLVLELARLLDQDGDHEAARQEYRRFLDLWKNADPDLPELAEAQTRLARLETTSS